MTVAGAPTGEHAQSGEQTHTTFCVIVKAMVSVEVTGLDEVVVEEVLVVEEGEVVELDLVVVLLAEVCTTDEVDVDVVGIVVVEEREDVELVVGLLVEIVLVVAKLGAFPTMEPTHAFQFVMPLRQVVEMGCPVC